MMVCRTQQSRLLSLVGLAIAFGLPWLAVVEYNIRADLSARNAAVILAVTPWLVLGWLVFAERRPLASVGLRHPDRSTLGFGLAGIAVYLVIAFGMLFITSASGLHQAQGPKPDLVSELMRRHGLIFVLMITNSAVLTEVALRGYAIERIAEFARGRLWVGAVVQIAITAPLFIMADLPHGLMWLVDDVAFCAFYVWRRDTVVCLAAHAVPNFVLSVLAALALVS